MSFHSYIHLEIAGNVSSSTHKNSFHTSIAHASILISGKCCVSVGCPAYHCDSSTLFLKLKAYKSLRINSTKKPSKIIRLFWKHLNIKKTYIIIDVKLSSYLKFGHQSTIL
jgi:hypothetical protein